MPSDNRALRSIAAQEERDFPLFWGVDFFFVVAFLTSYIVHVSGSFDVINANATRAAMACEYALIAYYLSVALLRAHLRVVALSLGVIFYLVFQSILFGAISHIPANPNAVLSFGLILSFVVVYESRVPISTILRVLLWLSVGYLLYYDVFWNLIATGGRSALSSDGVRGARAFLDGSLATYVLFAGIAIMRTRLVRAALLILISAYAIYVSQSRMFEAITAVVIVVALVSIYFEHLARISICTLCILFALLTMYAVFGFFNDSINPFAAVMRDPSGLARYYEYNDARRILSEHLLTGVGIAGSVADNQALVHPMRMFFPGDIGVSGIAFTFGVPAAIIFIVFSIVCILSGPSKLRQSEPLFFAQYWCVFGTALGGIYSPALFGGGGTLFAVISLILWKSHERSKFVCRGKAFAALSKEGLTIASQLRRVN